MPNVYNKAFGWTLGNWGYTGIFAEANRNNNKLSLLYGYTGEDNQFPFSIFEFKAKENVATLNDVLIKGDYINAYSNGSSVYSMYIFAYNFAGKPESGTLGSFKLYEYYVKDKDGNYKIHLLPSLDFNNKPCMFDIVSETFFYDENGNDFDYEL